MTPEELQTSLLTTNMRKLVHSCFLCVYGFDKLDDLQKHLTDHADGVIAKNQENVVIPSDSDSNPIDSIQACSTQQQMPINIPKHLTQMLHKKKPQDPDVRHQKTILIAQNGIPIVMGQFIQSTLQNRRTYVCPRCKVNFLRSREQYEMHMARNHSLEDYKCLDCPHEFFEHYKLRMLMKLETEGQYTLCPFCKRLVQNDALFELHFKRVHCKGFHTDSGEHHCKLCSNKFQKVSHLSCHIYKKHHGCVLCMDYFADKVSLWDHLGQAHDFRPYVCEKCEDSAFKAKLELKLHMAKIHGEGRLHTCPTCSEDFLSQSALRFHEKTRHPTSKESRVSEFKWKCQKCGQLYQFEKDLREHNRIHYKEAGRNIYECHFCPAWFEHAKSYLERHIKKQHPESLNVPDGEHQCIVCDNRFCEEKHLSSHIYICHHRCTYCSQYFRTEAELKTHSGEAHDLSVFECNKCESAFQSSDELKDHKVLVHYKPFGRKGGQYNCTLCEAVFQSKAKLKSHQQDHIIPTFNCTICGEKFKCKTHLKGHMKSHRVEKPKVLEHKCTICDKIYSSSSHLKRHMNYTHLGLKPCNTKPCVYVNCPICDRQFLKGDLDRHIQGKHSGKTWKCEVCQKVFKWKHSLDVHRKDHAEGPYPCDKCGRIVPTRKALTLHIRNKHQKNYNRKVRHSCTKCDKTFWKTAVYKRHLLTHDQARSDTECKICKKDCESNYERIVHQMTHVRLKPYFCDTCGNRYSYQTNVTSHQAYANCTSFKRRFWNCGVCLKWFENEKDFTAHSSVHEGRTLFECSQCSRGFNRLIELLDHIVDHVVKSEWNETTPKGNYSFTDPLKCQVCCKYFPTVKACKEHSDTHDKTHQFSCTECNTGFKKYDNFTKHLTEHFSKSGQLRLKECLANGQSEKGGVRPEKARPRKTTCRKKSNPGLTFECKICGKAFRTKYGLTIHMSEHTDKFRIKCLMCDSAFKYKFLLVKHMKEVHDVQEESGPNAYLNKCELCNKSFWWKQSLRLHMLIHTGKMLYKCTCCNAKFKYKLHLNTHLGKVHGIDYQSKITLSKMTRMKSLNAATCKSCGKVFRTKYGLKLHMSDHKRKFQKKCMMCHSTFKYKFQLLKHMKDVHNVPEENGSDASLHKCILCDRRFRWKSSLLLHMQVHLAQQSFQCSQCNEKFKLKFHLDIHMREAHSVDPEKPEFRCGICSKVLYTPHGLKLHFSQHTGKLEEKCKMCDSAFRHKHQLDKHMEKEHDVKGKSYQCHECGQEFRKKQTLEVHATLHNREANFECNICGKSFSIERQLRVHMVRHKEKQFSCDVCGKAFVRECELKIHAIRHDKKAYKFSCEWCSKKFCIEYELKCHIAAAHDNSAMPHKMQWCDICQRSYLKSTYRIHMQKHADVKPFTCEVCGKGFSYKCSLKLHMPEHTGEFDHKCSICESSFKYKYQLDKHMENKHEVEPQKLTGGKDLFRKCEICDAALKDRIQLDKHMVDEHGEEPMTQSKRLQTREALWCEICLESFKTKQHYENHMEDEHNDD